MNDIPAARLKHQRLIGPPLKTSGQAVEWLGAMQAQEYAFAKWAISLRSSLTAKKIEDDFNRGRILRTHVLRPTWHFVAPGDIRWMLALTGPRIRSSSASLATRLGVDAPLERRALRVLERVLHGRTLTRAEIKDEFRRARVDASGAERCALLLMYAELRGLITSGPRRDNLFTYALLDERAPAAPAFDRNASLGELARRYFQSRRPATVQDFSWWSGLVAADARRAIDIARVKLDQRDVVRRQVRQEPLPAHSGGPTIRCDTEGLSQYRLSENLRWMFGQVVTSKSQNPRSERRDQTGAKKRPWVSLHIPATIWPGSYD